MMRFFVFILILLSAVSSFAAENPLKIAENPLEISASKALEWNRAARTYTATGDVVVKQGALQITGGKLVASYGAGSSTDIDKLVASENVAVKSAPYAAYGDNAVYDVVSGHAVLTGSDLRIETPEEKLTADQSIEYFKQDGRLIAKGNATAIRGTDTLTAPEIAAVFAAGADGKMTMEKMTASGGVTIKTAKETVKGDQGVYDLSAQKAQLTGKVRIYQGDSWIEGTKADIDLKTGISRLSSNGNSETQGRVKGVFYPKGKPAGQ